MRISDWSSDVCSSDLARRDRERQHAVSTAVHPMPLLTVEHLTMRFGGLLAVNDVSLEAAQENIAAINGPHGAGKTPVFTVLTGLYQTMVGRITLNRGHDSFCLERMSGFSIPPEPGGARPSHHTPTRP